MKKKKRIDENGFTTRRGKDFLDMIAPLGGKIFYQLFYLREHLPLRMGAPRISHKHKRTGYPALPERKGRSFSPHLHKARFGGGGKKNNRQRRQQKPYAEKLNQRPAADGRRRKQSAGRYAACRRYAQEPRAAPARCGIYRNDSRQP